eukprot:Em0004g118a
MDLSDSMAAPLATVKSISQLIAQQVSSITTNVRIGFGAFNDKPTYPYSPQTPAGCLPGRDAPDCSDRRAGTRQYSFLHLVNFTSIFTDYPSVGLVASLLKKYDVIPILALSQLHQALQDLMTSVGTKAFARPISSSASDVLDDQKLCTSGSILVTKTCHKSAIVPYNNISLTLTLLNCNTPHQGLGQRVKGQNAAQQVSSFTTNVRIGFGAFNDKPIYPYSPQTPAGCLPGRDALDCSDRYLMFVTTNLDLPESSFDALVQVLACEQELGWRNRSVEGPERGLQRVVLLITDNQPHLLASIYQPNDGKCHDYPSVGLVASLLKKYDVIPIFGIVPITSSSPGPNTSVGTKALHDQSSSASDVLDVIKLCTRSGLESKCGITGQKQMARRQRNG